MNSVLLLCWNELEVAKDSVRRLLKEPGVDEVIVVDNGSTDGSQEYFNALKGTEKFGFVSLPKNEGSSVARNMGIMFCKGDYIFLLDGDILYVPGTVLEYKKVLDFYPDAACVGQNSYALVAQMGYNGTAEQAEADMRMSEDYTVSEWFPMAWTQYGLFRGDFLRKHPFVELPPFNEAGWGYEDDWLFHEIKEAGMASLSVDKPLYYHFAHSGIRELMKEGLSTRAEERKKVFEKRWGKMRPWTETINNHTTRPHP